MEPRTYIGSSYGQGQPGGVRGFWGAGALSQLHRLAQRKELDSFGHQGAFYLKVGAARDHACDLRATAKKVLLLLLSLLCTVIVRC